MCFYIHEKYPDVQVADKDIECYKILKFSKESENKISPFQNEVYFKKGGNSEYVIKKVKKFSFDSDGDIYEGLHTYSDFPTSREVKSGFQEIYAAVIPKGTKYYYDPFFHEYVSLKLKVFRKCIK